MLPLHLRIRYNKLRQSLLHLWIECLAPSLFFLDLLSVKPPKNVLRMNAQLPGLGTNDLGQALIRGQVRLSNLVDQSALKLHRVTLVRDRRLSLLIPSRPASFRFDILAHLPIIEFLALFSDLLVYAIEFELADHDHWV